MVGKASAILKALLAFVLVAAGIGLSFWFALKMAGVSGFFRRREPWVALGAVVAVSGGARLLLGDPGEDPNLFQRVGGAVLGLAGGVWVAAMVLGTLFMPATILWIGSGGYNNYLVFLATIIGLPLWIIYFYMTHKYWLTSPGDSGDERTGEA